MIENLKIALKRQKRLIIIFLLTIFLPSISLSIFGIRAIRNERFRLAKLIESEHRRAADYLKSQVSSQFKELGSTLVNLARLPSVSKRNYSDIRNQMNTQLGDNPLIEQVFLAYGNEEPLFPLFQPISINPMTPSRLLTNAQAQRLKRAEEYEFKQQRYESAIPVYQELFNLSQDRNFQAQMLSNISRCLMKAANYDEAIKNYQKIFEEYPLCLTSSKLPLALISQLQIVNCYRNLGDFQNALKASLALYRDILHMTWYLSEAQFKTYSSLAEEAIAGILSENQNDFSEEESKQPFEQLRILHQERIHQWQSIQDLKLEIIPDLRRRLIQPSEVESAPFYYSKIIRNTPILISAVMIPGGTDANSSGILGAKIENEYLKENILGQLIENMQFSENTNIVISDLSGRPLLGKKEPAAELTTITEFFRDNFPPWRIEFFRSNTSSLGIIDIRKSFYFWTIVVLIVVLIFGALLIMRTISHEMEVLKIKSDFVSSISHEFKTPLTSIRALAERLQDGKVKNEAKMQQYFSFIAQDTDKLTRLVKNILDFSKIEDGKKEYDFVETDVAQLVDQQIQTFRTDELHKDVKVHFRIFEDIPKLEVDREALYQVINNLLDNAVKFSPAKKGIDVNIRKEAESVIIEVKDEGIGIPQDELDKIFDKFYQGKNALKQTVKGTGLGLTLAKHAIEAHGGRITVKSKVGEGTTFSLIFPIKRGKK